MGIMKEGLMKEYICIVAHREMHPGGKFVERRPGDRDSFSMDPGPYWRKAEPETKAAEDPPWKIKKKKEVKEDV
jgi:hypothetical protein